MSGIRVQPRASNERPVCVSCRGELGQNDAALACNACDVPLHWECWRGLKRCPTPGCEGKAKHSDRLTAELVEWGPVAPTVRELDEPNSESEWGPEAAPVARLEQEPDPPAKSDPKGKAPAPTAPVTQAAPHERRSAPRARRGLKIGEATQFCMIAGSVVGLALPILAMHHPSLLASCGGLIAGGSLGFVLGILVDSILP